MRIKWLKAEKKEPIDRIYIAAVTLKEFRQKKNVEAQLFRAGVTEAEMEAYKGKNLVGPAPAEIPAEVLKGATGEAALACLLEAFTEEEIGEMAKYLEERYGGQMEKLDIGPMELPVPLGIGPLGQIPETENSGFINFDLAPGYPLNFKFKGYYDLNS